MLPIASGLPWHEIGLTSMCRNGIHLRYNVFACLGFTWSHGVAFSFLGVIVRKGKASSAYQRTVQRVKGKVKQVAVGTRQPTAQSRGIKHDAVTQAGAVEVPLPPVPSAPFPSEIIPGEALIIPRNTFAFSSFLGKMFDSLPRLFVF